MKPDINKKRLSRFLKFQVFLIKKALPEKDADIFIRHIIKGETLESIGSDYQHTGERVRQIAERASKEYFRKMYHLINESERLCDEVKRLRFLDEYVKQLERKLEIRDGDKNLIAVEDLPISMRVFNALKVAKCNTVSDVLEIRPSQLLGIRGFGIKSLRELKGCLLELGLEMKD